MRKIGGRFELVLAGLLGVVSVFLLLGPGCSTDIPGTGDWNSTDTVPDETRFERIFLDEGLDEPIELDVLPDGRVIYVERYGDVHLYDPDRRRSVLLAEIDVKAVFSQGLLGLTVDPDFEQNGWVYFYYSPTDTDREIQRLSRFRLRENELRLATEQVILEVPIQRQYHAHDG